MQDKKPYNKQKQPHGHWETYFTNGQLKYIGDYDNGKKIGIHKELYDNGIMDEYIEYVNDNHQYHESRYDDGVIAYKGHYLNYVEIGYWFENFSLTPNEHFYYAI